MASNTGEGRRVGPVKDRYQVLNFAKNLWDVFDGSGNHLRQKKSPGPAKGIEKRVQVKPPRIK